MKNLTVYYCCIFIPLLMIVGIAYAGLKEEFIIALSLYVLVYRPLLDGQRLVSKGVIRKSERWKAFFPLFTVRHFKALYLP